MENDLKLHHILVLVALFVSLVGTLLLLDKMSTEGNSPTSATTVIDEEAVPDYFPQVQAEEEGIVHVIDANQTKSK